MSGVTMKRLVLNPFTLIALGVSAAFLLGTLPGCSKVTYPKERLIARLIEICQKEYNIKVGAKISGSNLGVHINFATLFGDNFDFKEDALNILEDVLTSVRRVCLSTDSNFEFYTVVGSDRNNGVELVMTRNILDLKQVMYGNIGRNDYAQRMMLKVRPDVNLLGERKLRKFFSDMATGRIERIISNNFATGTTLKDISSSFFLSLLELGMKGNIAFKIQELKFIPVTADDGLFYVKVQETYVPKQGYETNSFSFPSGYEYEYLFLVSCKDFIPGIKKIIPLNSVDSLHKDKVNFPAEFARYENVEAWGDDNFYLEEVTMPEFLANQIAQRIKSKINADAATKLLYNIESIEGNYGFLKRPEMEGPEITTIKKQNYELVLRFKKKGSLQSEGLKAVPKQILKISLDVIKEVCQNYHYEDFSKIRLLDTNNEELLSVDSGIFKANP